MASHSPSTPHDEQDWLRLHADVLFETDAEGRLTRLNEPDPETGPPRLFLARGRVAKLLRVSAAVPGPAAARLERVADDLPGWVGGPPGPAAYAALRDALGESGAVAEESAGPAFRFPAGRRQGEPPGVILVDETTAHLLDRHFPYTRAILGWRSPVLGIVRDGAIVSACYAARRRPGACEAGVATEAAYRGLGLATAVVEGWAHRVEAAGMTPLYSTSWENGASLAVAARLGLVPYADTLSLT